MPIHLQTPLVAQRDERQLQVAGQRALLATWRSNSTIRGDAR